MHELSIAQSLVELVCDHATREKAARVQRIHLRLGELSGFRRALYFCFDAVARGTLCEGAALFIEEVPLTLRCPHCQTIAAPYTRHAFRCRACGLPAAQVVSGREMQISGIELEFDEPQPPATGLRPGVRSLAAT